MWPDKIKYMMGFYKINRKIEKGPTSSIPNAHSSVAFLQFSSVAQSCPTLCNPMNRRTPGLPVHYQLLESTQTCIHWVSDAIQPSHPPSSLFLLPPIPPSIRVISNESTLRMRWPKYWSFSFSIVSCKKPKMHCQKFCSSQTCIGKVCSLMLCINRKYIVHA